MITILDFYIDEPACLGVPPYFSPYCRYVAGALVDGGIPTEQITYLTVDQWRENGKELKDDPELVIIIAGSTVPGKYLGGKLGTVSEIMEFLDFRSKYQKNTVTLIGGPIRHASDGILQMIRNKKGIVIKGDIEVAAAKFAENSNSIQHIAEKYFANQDQLTLAHLKRDTHQLDKWALDGSYLTALHPNFPYLMLEIETYRGCTRQKHCSFCSEVFYGKPVFRPSAGIIAEIKEQYQLGNRYFRLGRQADLYTYGSQLQSYTNGFPKPEPSEIERLYSGIRQIAPNLKVLHLDNVNPGGVVAFPQQSAEITKIISKYNTAGDTAAMGLETVDPVVFEINKLKCQWDDALRAIEIINEYGGQRDGGIPKLLPGLNFIHGLPGESIQTFEKNYEFLKEVLKQNLLLRRINIRQVTIHPKTKAEMLSTDPDIYKTYGISRKQRKPSLLQKKFVYYRDKIRKEIDREMLKRVFPPGTILKEVIPEIQNPGFILGRQLGSYPVTVKVPLDDPTAVASLQNKKPMDIIVTGYKERSLLGISYPIQINRLGRTSLMQIPGIGSRRAGSVALQRPLNNLSELIEITENLPFGCDNDYLFST